MSLRVLAACAALLLAACGDVRPPLALAPDVQLARFMGDWFVVAHVPTPTEREAHNAVESYRSGAGGAIEIAFRYRDGGFDGEEKRLSMRGAVQPATGNAVWDVQWIWPLSMDYRIAWVAPDYSVAIIGRERRDYVWILARSPEIPEADLRHAVEFIAAQGYDVRGLRRVPQRWT